MRDSLNFIGPGVVRSEMSKKFWPWSGLVLEPDRPMWSWTSRFLFVDPCFQYLDFWYHRKSQTKDLAVSLFVEILFFTWRTNWLQMLLFQWLLLLSLFIKNITVVLLQSFSDFSTDWIITIVYNYNYSLQSKYSFTIVKTTVYSSSIVWL